MDILKNYRNRASESLSGHWAEAVIITLIFMVIYTALNLLPSFTIDAVNNPHIFALVNGIIFLVILPMSWGFAIAFLDLVRSTGYLGINQLFSGYQGGNIVRVLSTLLLENIYIFLWSLLLVVPGIVKSYSYSMTAYVLRDEPELRNNAAIERSMKLMKGKKMKLFLLDLSFIGWMLLSLLTAGLGFLLLIPYMQTAHAHFYEDLLEEEYSNPN